MHGVRGSAVEAVGGRARCIMKRVWDKLAAPWSTFMSDRQNRALKSHCSVVSTALDFFFLGSATTTAQLEASSSTTDGQHKAIGGPFCLSTVT